MIKGELKMEDSVISWAILGIPAFIAFCFFAVIVAVELYKDSKKDYYRNRMHPERYGKPFRCWR